MERAHTSRPLFVVAPAPPRWRCWQEGGGPSSVHGTRNEAIDRARELARAAGNGRVRVHNASGGLEQQWTYVPQRRGHPTLET